MTRSSKYDLGLQGVLSIIYLIFSYSYTKKIPFCILTDLSVESSAGGSPFGLTSSTRLLLISHLVRRLQFGCRQYHHERSPLRLGKDI